jgi:hypothetical protein
MHRTILGQMNSKQPEVMVDQQEVLWDVGRNSLSLKVGPLSKASAARESDPFPQNYWQSPAG